MLVLQCSPRSNGVCSSLACSFAEGFSSAWVGTGACSWPKAGQRPKIIHLADYAVQPCTGCGFCGLPPYSCRLDRHDDDQAAELFAMIHPKESLLVLAPIYFYALPAHLKALVDRAQKFYHQRICQSPGLTLVALVAGRSRGRQLFNGALLTMKYFLASMGRRIDDLRLLPGQDDLGDKTAQSNAISEWGKLFAMRLAAARGLA